MSIQTAKFHNKGWTGYQIDRISGFIARLDSRYRDTHIDTECDFLSNTGYLASKNRIFGRSDILQNKSQDTIFSA